MPLVAQHASHEMYFGLSGLLTGELAQLAQPLDVVEDQSSVLAVLVSRWCGMLAQLSDALRPWSS
jgi:hypothetical protein